MATLTPQQTRAARRTWGDRARNWLLPAVALERVAVLRVLVYLFVPLDVLLLHTIGDTRSAANAELYSPLLIGRLLHLPVPNETLVLVCKWGSALLALAALSGRAPRVLGVGVLLLWAEYQVVAFSYGKVDHDRFAFLVALAVLPTVGRARLRGCGSSEAAGWALRSVQLAVVATYFYAAWAKVRFGGWEWVNSATLARAVDRRGTVLSEWMLDVPWTLHVGQWVIVAFELLAPVVLFVNERWRLRIVAFFLAFHLATYAGTTIFFWPHTLCLAAFLPLERLAPRLAVAAERARERLGLPGTRSPARTS
ncbi:HTTM domain-containing protein [Motilibacter aurantiacus]|uniref:HTTM domain-containing protein n=1 Tax=Motilibacter aurantiacus TaxID=2714955 RepID=UPI00140E0679|nr:HTTM domain-containing protein [Motilibacter aurantiacus]NHC46079.1 HTTM domain-containing protein [Motilibacter aurantiacus]